MVLLAFATGGSSSDRKRSRPIRAFSATPQRAMNLHLAEIAATVAPAGHALLFDQAGWHLSTRLLVPANITIILLPPKCPELNPVENVWQFMCDNWLSNRIFKSFVDHCCAAMEQARRPALAHHVHRTAPMGPRVLINGICYKM
jgi:hypothetical protein